MREDWLEIAQGNAPLILSIPHAGIEIPETYLPALNSLWLARKDADWWLPQLYAFAEKLGATIIRTHISRTVIDVNRDPSGASLYPGQATTGLCPTTTFDGEPLYRDGLDPDAEDIAERARKYFVPYHAALKAEISRLKNLYPSVVLYDCHSIRSNIPRLFPGTLPNFNIGTADGASCDPALTRKILEICAAATEFNYVVNGRFKGGWITRAHGDPSNNVHAVQMELSCRGYMREAELPDETNWPGQYDAAFAAPLQKILQSIFESILS
jgi:N-formylglutamate deformylase